MNKPLAQDARTQMLLAQTSDVQDFFRLVGTLAIALPISFQLSDSDVTGAFQWQAEFCDGSVLIYGEHASNSFTVCPHSLRIAA